MISLTSMVPVCGNRDPIDGFVSMCDGNTKALRELLGLSPNRVWS